MDINDLELKENLQVAVNDAYIVRPVGEDDWVRQCKNCFTYEDHTIFCPVPAIERWLKESK